MTIRATETPINSTTCLRLHSDLLWTGIFAAVVRLLRGKPSAMSSSSSDLSNRDVAVMRQRRGTPLKFMLPLIYAPILPLIRIGFRRNPVVRDRLFYGVLAAAFAHGGYLVTDLYDIESK